MYFPKTASVTLTNGCFVDADGSGGITSATAAATALVGVVNISVASTDSDFASTTSLPCTRAIPECTVFEADVTGTLLTTHVGNVYDLSADGQYINIAGTTTKQLRVVKYLSASKAEVVVVAATAFAE